MCCSVAVAKKLIPVVLLLMLLDSSLAATGNGSNDNNSTHAGMLSFLAEDILRWNHQYFVDETQYQLAEYLGVDCVYAKAQGSSSGLFYEKSVAVNTDIELQWQWFGIRQSENNNELSKEGDDFMLRLYVIKKHSWLPWRSQSLMYVWSAQQKQGSSWGSPYTGQVKLISVADAKNTLLQWHTFVRNPAEDFEQLFGEPLERIDAIAIMTDADGLTDSAEACYGSIRLKGLSE